MWTFCFVSYCNRTFFRAFVSFFIDFSTFCRLSWYQRLYCLIHTNFNVVDRLASKYSIWYTCILYCIDVWIRLFIWISQYGLFRLRHKSVFFLLLNEGTICKYRKHHGSSVCIGSDLQMCGNFAKTAEIFVRFGNTVSSLSNLLFNPYSTGTIFSLYMYIRFWHIK